MLKAYTTHTYRVLGFAAALEHRAMSAAHYEIMHDMKSNRKMLDNDNNDLTESYLIV